MDKEEKISMPVRYFKGLTDEGKYSVFEKLVKENDVNELEKRCNWWWAMIVSILMPITGAAAYIYGIIQAIC